MSDERLEEGTPSVKGLGALGRGEIGAIGLESSVRANALESCPLARFIPAGSDGRDFLEGSGGGREKALFIEIAVLRGGGVDSGCPALSGRL